MSGRPGKQPGPLRYAGDPETRGGFPPLPDRVHRLDGRDALLVHTVKNRRIELGYFIDWCEERSITRPDEVTRALLERYRQHVFHYRRRITARRCRSRRSTSG
jgi:integrase/recombinase XerD